MAQSHLPKNVRCQQQLRRLAQRLDDPSALSYASSSINTITGLSLVGSTLTLSWKDTSFDPATQQLSLGTARSANVTVSADDIYVKVSATDSTTGYLSSKLTASNDWIAFSTSGGSGTNQAYQAGHADPQARDAAKDIALCAFAWADATKTLTLTPRTANFDAKGHRQGATDGTPQDIVIPDIPALSIFPAIITDADLTTPASTAHGWAEVDPATWAAKVGGKSGSVAVAPAYEFNSQKHVPVGTRVLMHKLPGPVYRFDASQGDSTGGSAKVATAGNTWSVENQSTTRGVSYKALSSVTINEGWFGSGSFIGTGGYAELYEKTLTACADGNLTAVAAEVLAGTIEFGGGGGGGYYYPLIPVRWGGPGSSGWEEDGDSIADVASFEFGAGLRGEYVDDDGELDNPVLALSVYGVEVDGDNDEAGYLSQKLTAGTGIAFSTAGTGVTRAITISSGDGSGGTAAMRYRWRRKYTYPAPAPGTPVNNTKTVTLDTRDWRTANGWIHGRGAESAANVAQASGSFWFVLGWTELRGQDVDQLIGRVNNNSGDANCNLDATVYTDATDSHKLKIDYEYSYSGSGTPVGLIVYVEVIAVVADWSSATAGDYTDDT